MSDPAHEELRRLFDLALAAPPAQRGPLLDRECRGDARVRQRVEAMVAAAEDDRFLSGPTRGDADATPTGDFPPATPTATAAREAPGARIGPYKLLQQIGEGGFGSVFMAEQEKPVARRVALKIIKLGMDTRQVVARFEQERQALAVMDHPNIAKVLDAGSTETGRPYFVMELVRGDPIVEYCDKNNLSIQDRLELFTQVCLAVQHAHTKGIIHRDIKPSNILVSTQDGRPHTKVIDFGIAKATATRLTEKTLFTEHRALIGTPEYMSPEQAEGNLDIDTRTDVYSLGVLLYELLTGTTPFSGSDLRSAAYAEIQRIIREVDPPKPSTRLGHNTDTIASVAARRHVEPRKLGTIVRGELDWIVMKALEKDRSRRYETASGLGMDIRRYLSGEAVLAAPPSPAYRLRKLARRHRVVVSAASAVAAALLIGAAAFAWQARVARTQRDIAIDARTAGEEQRRQAEAARADALAQKARAEAKEAEAKAHAAVAEAVARFQIEMLAAADPSNLGGDRITVLQAMQAAVRELDQGALKDQPLVEAGVREAIGNTLRGLGRYDAAEPHLRRSLELRRGALPAGHLDIAHSLNTLGLILKARNNLDEAEPLYREALAVRRAALPAGHPDIAQVLNNLALLLQARNRPAEAEPMLRDALSIRRAALPAGHPDIATTLNNLAAVLQARNNPAEAEPLYREALAIRRQALPPGHPDTADSLHNLAWLLQSRNKPAEAEPLSREALSIRRAILPADHRDLAAGLTVLGLILKAQNKLAEAEPLFRESLTIRRAGLPAGHADLGPALQNLANLLQARGNLAEAEPLYREALEIDRKNLPPGDVGLALSLNNLATLLQAQNRPAEAVPLLREALGIARGVFPPGHANLVNCLTNLARAQQGLGQVEDARAGFDEAIAMLRQASPKGSANLARVLWRSGCARLENKDTAALRDLEEALRLGSDLLPADHPHLKDYREAVDRARAAADPQNTPSPAPADR